MAGQRTAQTLKHLMIAAATCLMPAAGALAQDVDPLCNWPVTLELVKPETRNTVVAVNPVLPIGDLFDPPRRIAGRMIRPQQQSQLPNSSIVSEPEPRITTFVDLRRRASDPDEVDINLSSEIDISPLAPKFEELIRNSDAFRGLDSQNSCETIIDNYRQGLSRIDRYLILSLDFRVRKYTCLFGGRLGVALYTSEVTVRTSLEPRVVDKKLELKIVSVQNNISNDPGQHELLRELGNRMAPYIGGEIIDTLERDLVRKYDELIHSLLIGTTIPSPDLDKAGNGIRSLLKDGQTYQPLSAMFVEGRRSPLALVVDATVPEGDREHDLCSRISGLHELNRVNRLTNSAGKDSFLFISAADYVKATGVRESADTNTERLPAVRNAEPWKPGTTQSVEYYVDTAQAGYYWFSLLYASQEPRTMAFATTPPMPPWTESPTACLEYRCAEQGQRFLVTLQQGRNLVRLSNAPTNPFVHVFGLNFERATEYDGNN